MATFLKINFNGKINLIKVPDLRLQALNQTLQTTFGISEVIYYTTENIEINNNDVIDYIRQFINDSNFILNINVDNNFNAVTNRSEIVENYDIIADALEISENLENKEELQKLLEQNHKIIFENYRAKRVLSNFERIKISKTIIQHMLKDPARVISTIELQNISETICQVFEEELPTTFYTKYCEGRHASGKLHDAYNNYRSSLAAAGLIVRRSKSKTPICRELDLDKAVNTQSDSEELNNALQLLSTEVDYGKCKCAWQITFAHRQNILNGKTPTADYIKKFPVLEQEDGYQLYFIDVAAKFNTSVSIELPEVFLNKITARVTKFKSESVFKILELIGIEPEVKKKSLLALMLLPYLFPASLKRNVKGLIKPTKVECADTFVCHFEDIASAHSGILRLTEAAKKNTNEIQPFIVLIGSPVQVAWVTVAHIRYSFEDIDNAFKCAIATYLALNIKYPTYSDKAWFFLQKYVFHVSTTYDSSLENKVKTIAKDLHII